MNKQAIESRRQDGGIALVRMSVKRVEAEQVVREGSTGRVVSVMPTRPERPKMTLLPRVWAVAECEVASPEAAVILLNPMEGGCAGDGLGDGVGDGVGDGMGDGMQKQEAAVEAGDEPEQQPGLAFYRKYTEGMLRRYVRMSMACGRVPSLLGRELFQGKITSYKVTNFEDMVIFCFDMEKMLERLRPMDQRLVKRIGMQEYTQAETATMFRMSLRTVLRTYGEAVDRLTAMLLEAGMLETLKSCQ